MKIREQVRAEEPLCRTCLAAGLVAATTEVDHIVPLSRGGSNERGNLQGLCYPCHKAKTIAEGGRRLDTSTQERRLPRGLRPSRIPLVIVCGPPGSGKSTFVRDRAGPADLVLDLDVIMAELSGLAVHAPKPGWVDAGLDERNERLRALGQNPPYQRAWFVIGCPDAGERAWWARELMAEAVEVLAVPLQECERRIRQDPTRAGREAEMVTWAARWWDVYSATLTDGGEG